MKRGWLWIPFLIFIGFFALVRGELANPSERTIRSRMVGKQLPMFSLAPAHAPQPGLGSANFKQGQPRLLNIFASWCIPCAAETPILLELSRQGVEINAIAIRDRPQDVARFLTRYGNPYARIGADNDSAVQLSLGSSGVPETFVVNSRGVITHQHVGDIRREDISQILAELRAAQ